MIVIATILCDRKSTSQLIGIPAAAKFDTTGIPGGVRYYVNIESENLWSFGPLWDWLNRDCPVPWDLDLWELKSKWRPKPRFDQDQARLLPIVAARNFARAYALNFSPRPGQPLRDEDCSHLLFIDADVIPEPDGLKRLLALDRPYCGGYVPGRGAHRSVYYVFHKQPRRPEVPKSVIECAYGTMGYCLIRRDVLSLTSFRYGRHPERASWEEQKDTVRLSEDPAFSADALNLGFGHYWVDTHCRAQHWDDPQNPLKHGGTARDGEIRA